MAIENIGFIGIGNMGGPMARNLLKKGYRIKVFDISRSAMEAAIATGAIAASSAQAAASDVEVVITMLPSGMHVREVYLGGNGVIAAAKKGTLLVDSSTIDVETARNVIDAATRAGMDMIDAPVSGGVGGAENATLTFMVGGSEVAFQRAKPILEAMGKTIVHAGGPGNGQAAKICNNMILGVSMIVVSEAFILAERLNLESQKLFEIASKSSGQCWALTSYCPVPGPVPASPANRDYRAGFTAEMMHKDLCLSQEASKRGGVATPLGAMATELYTLFVNSGSKKIDFSGIIKMLKGKAQTG